MQMDTSRVSRPICEPISTTAAKAHLRVDGSHDDTLIGSLISAARSHVEEITNRPTITSKYAQTMRSFSGGRSIDVVYGPIRSVESVTYLDTAGVRQTYASSGYGVDTNVMPPRVTLAYDQTWPVARMDTGSVKVTYFAGDATRAVFNDADDEITATGHGIADNQIIQFSDSGSNLPTEIVAGESYYVINTSGDTFQIAATEGGDAITFTGSPTCGAFVGAVNPDILHAMLMLIGHWYEHPDAVIVGTGAVETPLAVRTLLLPYHVWRA